MEIKNWTYEDFPEYMDCPNGAVRMATTGDEIGILYIHDVEYAVVDGISLHLQILKPQTRNEPSKKYPCIVYVQGSAWMEQNVYSEVGLVSSLAKRGYVVAIVQYRHSGQAPFPAQIQDAKNAVRFMRKNAEQYDVNPDQIIAAGCSSGGHTAVFCGIVEDDSEMDRNLFPGVSAQVKGILNYYGSVSLLMWDGNPTTLNHKLPDSPEGMLFRANLRERRDLAEMGTAVTYITPEFNMPPCCIFHGTKDFIVNAKESVELYEKLKECGKDAYLYLVEGGMHGGAEFWTMEACDKADAFIKHCLEK